MDKSLTIVLPVHNGESRLRTQVREMLDLASELTADFRILIVDDGSTDATFEVAGDLAAHYPQVTVRRHRHRSGVGPAIDYVRRKISSDAVIVHDGVTPVDCNQMRKLWRGWIAQTRKGLDRCSDSETAPHEICDFSDLPAIHVAMERAHQQVLGFQLIFPARSESAARCSESPEYSIRTDGAPTSKRSGVGTIPRLPRPKFLSTIARFALGE